MLGFPIVKNRIVIFKKVQCNIGSQCLSATFGSVLKTTNLLFTVPTPNDPTCIETFIPGSAGIKSAIDPDKTKELAGSSHAACRMCKRSK